LSCSLSWTAETTAWSESPPSSTKVLVKADRVHPEHV